MPVFTFSGKNSAGEKISGERMAAIRPGPTDRCPRSSNQYASQPLSRIRCWERVSYPHPAGVVSVAFAPNRRTLVTGGSDGIIRVWDPASLKAVARAELVNHSGPVRVLQITSDSMTLVSVGDGPRVLNWDLPNTRLARDWDVPPGGIGALAITSDGRYLAIGRPEGAVDVCRIAEKRA